MAGRTAQCLAAGQGMQWMGDGSLKGNPLCCEVLHAEVSQLLARSVLGTLSLHLAVWGSSHGRMRADPAVEADSAEPRRSATCALEGEQVPQRGMECDPASASKRGAVGHRLTRQDKPRQDNSLLIPASLADEMTCTPALPAPPRGGAAVCRTCGGWRETRGRAWGTGRTAGARVPGWGLIKGNRCPEGPCPPSPPR